jgi:type 1 glutamine amidotransferase/nicotinamidase-related amidase
MPRHLLRNLLLSILSILSLLSIPTPAIADTTLSFPVQHRPATPHGHPVVLSPASWQASESAVILCDFWDSHTSARAAHRVQQLAPRIAAVIAAARQSGVLIIHAPSDTMPFYQSHPARQRTLATPAAPDLPADLSGWLDRLNPSETAAGDPIDSSSGGSDDSPDEALAWQAVLQREGRLTSRYPWKQQHPLASIDPDKDFISDRGTEVWNILRARNIRHVFIAGVHTNKCICGRSFGIRQLVRHGIDTVLLRDLTDALYNPAEHPFVPHVHGTSLMVAHIERHLCSTALSSAVFGGTTPPLTEDSRIPVAVLTGENEYHTAESLAAFFDKDGTEFRPSWISAPPDAPGNLLQSDALDHAAVILVSMRRTALSANTMAALRRAISRGAAVVGIRTASHAFALRPGTPTPPDRETWPDWDASILGGNYQNHHGPDAKVTVHAPDSDHPILAGLPRTPFPSGGSLYLNSPLQKGTRTLLTASAAGIAKPEPVAWTFLTPAGAPAFCTSLGHTDDFASAPFRTLLRNALRWAASRHTTPAPR